MPTAHLVVDYQNIHLTGHGIWCPQGEPPHLCLVHPLHFANQVLTQRNLVRRLLAERTDEPFAPAVLGGVHVFRGQPSNRRDSASYRRTQAQQAEWTRDPRVTVVYRTLKYYTDGPAKEKGIDVLVALELIKRAAYASKTDGVVILAAHDTDQEPALEMAQLLGNGAVETAGWREANVLRVPGVQVWHTKLDEGHFERARDRKDYT